MMLICIFFFKKEPHVIMYDNDSTFRFKTFDFVVIFGFYWRFEC